MSLFSQNKDFKLRGLILKLVNNNCPEMKASIDGPRIDNRINLSVVVVVIPVEDGEIQIGDAFTSVTKDFSNIGMSLILDRPHGLYQAVLCLRINDEMNYVLAEARHLNPMGGGFYQLGFRLMELLTPADYPELTSVVV